MPQNLAKLDRNLFVREDISDRNFEFFDVRHDPFDVYGLYDYKNEPVFRRIPQQTADATSKKVASLNLHTAGGRVRFTTDSKEVAIRAKMSDITRFSHMTLAGTSGFDLYIDDVSGSTYYGTFMPPVGMDGGYDQLISFCDSKKRQITINFPLYNCVDTLLIGLSPGASLERGAKYSDQKPILYYGSSITQGGCASRPGNAYEAIISRRLNIDYVNLGFSGSGCAEDAIAAYIAQQDISLFVCDYDYNAPSVEYLRTTHNKLFQAVRTCQQTLPILLLSRPNTEHADVSENNLRRDVIYQTYEQARAAGDENVYFIDGIKLFGTEDRDMCTVDGAHPNDIGFYRMSRVIGDKILEIFEV